MPDPTWDSTDFAWDGTDWAWDSYPGVVQEPEKRLVNGSRELEEKPALYDPPAKSHFTGERTGWRYIAQRIGRNGPAEMIDPELPLSGVSITQSLSAPNELTGTVDRELKYLMADDGRPVLRDWGTLIWAELDGEIRGGGILTRTSMSGSSLSLECMGFAGYPQGMPFTESWYGSEIDALDVFRKIWDHLQSQPGGNLDLQIPDLMSGVIIGMQLDEDEYDEGHPGVTFDAGPYKLNWYSTDDLGQEIDDLAESTPFDYTEDHYWEGGEIKHKLRLGYPQLGKRRHDLRFVLGENIYEQPALETNGEEFANEMLALGAGEGRTMKRGYAARSKDTRLRRVAVVSEPSARTRDAINVVAKRELRKRRAGIDISELIVADHSHAPLGSFNVGDELLVQGESDWRDFDLWVRVLSYTISPDDSDSATLEVARADTDES